MTDANAEEMVTPMRSEFAALASTMADAMTKTLQNMLADVERGGGTSNEILSIGAQIVAAQMEQLVERLQQRARDQFGDAVPDNLGFLHEMVETVAMDAARRVLMVMAEKRRKSRYG